MKDPFNGKTPEEVLGITEEDSFNPESRDEKTGKFKPGVAPFPKGSKHKPKKGRNTKIADLRKQLLDSAAPHAIDALIEIVSRPGASRDKLTAARTILDFCIPKPKDSEGKSSEEHMIDLVRALRGEAPTPNKESDSDSTDDGSDSQ